LVILSVLYLGASIMDEVGDDSDGGGGGGHFYGGSSSNSASSAAPTNLMTLLLVPPPSQQPQASEIAEATTIKNDSPPTDRVWWSFPALLCDIVFLSWIYMSLVTIMKVLLLLLVVVVFISF